MCKYTPNLSIIVPAYKSAATLPILVERIDALWRQLELDDDSRELIIVNDGSPDSTWQVICRLAEQHAWVRGIDLMRNYGQHNALLCGIRAARFEVIVTMDDDLQHPPEEILRLLEKLQEGFDVVYGAPEHEQHGLGRDVASRITKTVLQSTMGAEIASHISAFRAFRTQVRGAFSNYESPSVSIDVLLTWATTRFAVIRVRHNPRMHGTSNYTLRKLITHAFNMLTGFSTIPLQLASIIGFVFTLFGGAVLVYVLGRYLLFGSGVPGFPFLASVIALLGGAQMFALGIIGEYLARMHFRSMGRPSSATREVIGWDTQSDILKKTPVPNAVALDNFQPNSFLDMTTGLRPSKIAVEADSRKEA
jgi:glycosyltransferase involved in cell wall biosynthesis